MVVAFGGYVKPIKEEANTGDLASLPQKIETINEKHK